MRVLAVIVVVALMGLPLVAGTVPAAKPEEVGLSTDRLKRIGEAVQRHIEANNVAGAVTLVARRGRIAHFEARGMMDLEAKKPMPKDGLFRLASMSKPITGVAIMMLVEEGKVRLSDPVSRFIPEFKGLDKVAVAKPGAPPAGARRRSRVRRCAGRPRDHDCRSAEARLRSGQRWTRCFRGQPASRRAHPPIRWPRTFRSSPPCRWISSPERCGGTAAWLASMC